MFDKHLEINHQIHNLVAGAFNPTTGQPITELPVGEHYE